MKRNSSFISLCTFYTIEDANYDALLYNFRDVQRNNYTRYYEWWNHFDFFSVRSNMIMYDKKENFYFENFYFYLKRYFSFTNLHYFFWDNSGRYYGWAAIQYWYPSYIFLLYFFVHVFSSLMYSLIKYILYIIIISYIITFDAIIIGSFHATSKFMHSNMYIEFLFLRGFRRRILKAAWFFAYVRMLRLKIAHNEIITETGVNLIILNIGGLHVQWFISMMTLDYIFKFLDLFLIYFSIIIIHIINYIWRIFSNFLSFFIVFLYYIKYLIILFFFFWIIWEYLKAFDILLQKY